MTTPPIDPARIGEAFQEATKYARGRPVRMAGFDPAAERRAFPDAERAPLPRPEIRGGPGLWNAISRRRSARSYSAEPARLDELSQMLWACQGVTGEGGGRRFRAAPSAGALYPCETYVVVNRVEDLDPGLYHYEVPEHELSLLRGGDLGPDVARAACDQAMCGPAALVFIWTAVVARCGVKYRQRAFRYIYLDAGHIGHSVALAAAGLGLGSCQIAAFFDDEVNAIVGADGRAETAVYMTSVGRPANH